MFKNLKISYKLILSTLIFFIPLSLLFYHLNSIFNEVIEKSIREKQGNSILKELVVLNEKVLQHNLLKLNNSNYDILNSLESEIELQFNKSKKTFVDKREIFSSSNKDYKNDNYKNELENLSKYWDEINSSKDSVNTSSYLSFYKSYLSLVKKINDNSGLILDPDLDSYYLMEITSVIIPEFQVKIAQILNEIYLSNKLSYISDYHYNRVRILSETILENDFDRIQKGINTTIKVDKVYYNSINNLKERLTQSLKSYHQSNLTFISTLENWYNYESDGFDSANQNIISQGIIFNSETMSLWLEVNKQFNHLLYDRINFYRNRKNIAIITSIFAFFISIILLLFVASQISKHLKIVTNIAIDIADGKIDKAVDKLRDSSKIGFFRKYQDLNYTAKDEIILLFISIKKMTLNVSNLLEKVSLTGKSVSDNTLIITGSSHEIETTIAQQAALTTQVTASSNDISSISAELARTMDFITDAFNQNSELLSTGLERLIDIKKTITNMFNSSEIISEKLSLINEKASGINSVITTITKVANQTNLVSLNASIEAERAGIYGTGFSVVASEIRRLADQTSIAALNIESMISEMQNAVKDGGNTINQYIINTKSGSEKTSLIIDQMSEIIDKTNELPEKIINANNMMRHQSESAFQISESMKHLNSAAIQTRNTIIEFNKATDKLYSVVNELTNELNKFSIGK